jgi:phosphoenolpyruvate carboxylase
MFNDSRLFRLIVDEAEKTLAYVDLGIAREYAGLVADSRVRDAIFPMIEEEYRRTVEVIRRLSGEREIADRFPQFRRRLARRPTNISTPCSCRSTASPPGSGRRGEEGLDSSVCPI